jgi:hypothetical protein
MNQIFLGNAFSLQMLNLEVAHNVSIAPVSIDEVKQADFVSVVGHPDTAAVLTDMLDKEVAYNRQSLSLESGDILYVAQIVGGRLPEGATTLPEGFKLSFVRVMAD